MDGDPGAGSQRGRARTACDLCRYRRVRCDGEKPACETCRLARVECVFTPRVRQRKDIRRELAETTAKVQQLQEALRAERARYQSQTPWLIPSPTAWPGPGSTDGLDSYGFDAAKEAFRKHLSYCDPTFSSAIHRAGYIFNIDEFLDQVSYSFRAQYPAHQSRTVLPKWPPQELVQRTIEYFSRTGLYSVFPVVQTETLSSDIDPSIICQPGNNMKAADIARPVALTALLGRIHRHEPEFADAEPDAYIQTALGLIPQLMMDSENLRTLESLVLLALYIFPTGQAQLAELLLSMSVRVLYNLRANHQTNKQHTRALFWLIYFIDKDLSLRQFQPPLIHDGDCTLSLPDTYVSESSTHRFLSKPLSPNELLFPSDLRLSLIKSKIYTLLYSKNAPTHPAQSSEAQARKLQHIRELDQELSEFKAAFPVTLPLDSFLSGMGRDVPDILLHDMSLRGYNIHLEYWFCLGRIHASAASTTATRGGDGGSGSGAVQSPLLSSSMNLCHQAARSTLLFMVRTRHFIMPGNFWIHAQSLLTSIITLFWYMIAANSAETFEEDLNILESIADTFKEIVESGKCGDGGDGRFPPFYITEKFVRWLIGTVRNRHNMSELHEGSLTTDIKDTD